MTPGCVRAGVTLCYGRGGGEQGGWGGNVILLLPELCGFGFLSLGIVLTVL